MTAVARSPEIRGIHKIVEPAGVRITSSGRGGWIVVEGQSTWCVKADLDMILYTGSVARAALFMTVCFFLYQTGFGRWQGTRFRHRRESTDHSPGSLTGEGTESYRTGVDIANLP